MSIAASKAYDKLEAAVKTQELTLDRTKKADQQLVYRLRKMVGYRVSNIGGVQTWQRPTGLSNEAIQHPPSPYPYTHSFRWVTQRLGYF